MRPQPEQAPCMGGTRKPLVDLVFDECESGDGDDLLAPLHDTFTCSMRWRDAPSTLAATRHPDLVIWQRTAARPPAAVDAASALAGVPRECPVIVIAQSLDAVPFQLEGSRPLADFVVRPCTGHELILRARRVLGQWGSTGSAAPSANAGKVERIVVGHSAALLQEVAKLKRFAACDAGVLILGETGTGKEVFAQAVHYASARAARPMVAVNCGAVPPELIEAELFGHVKGAYTNAHIARAGLVSEAEHGTLFLDDVDCLPLAAQAKLLRFLQEREYRVVGSNKLLHADVRVVAASNRDLAAMARQGSFREDLFYRLNILTLALPPLREHKEDIAALADHFLRHFGQRNLQPPAQLSPAALPKLLAYDWPGNVRELGHVLERASLMASDATITPADIDLPQADAPADDPEDFQAMKARVVQSFERGYIESLLTRTRGNVSEAARVAGKNRRALFELIRKHQIRPAAFRA